MMDEYYVATIITTVLHRLIDYVGRSQHYPRNVIYTNVDATIKTNSIVGQSAALLLYYYTISLIDGNMHVCGVDISKVYVNPFGLGPELYLYIPIYIYIYI